MHAVRIVLLVAVLAARKGSGEGSRPTQWNGQPLPPTRNEGAIPPWAGARNPAAVRSLVPVEVVLARHIHSVNAGVRVPRGNNASHAIASGVLPLDGALVNGTASASVWVGLRLGDDDDASSAPLAAWERRARLTAAATDLGGAGRNVTRQIEAMQALNASSARNDTSLLREAFSWRPRATELPRADGECEWAASRLRRWNGTAPGIWGVQMAGTGRAHVGAECWVDDSSGSAGPGSPWDIRDTAPAGIDLAVLVLIPGVPAGVALSHSEILGHALFRPRVAGGWVWSRTEQAWRSWAGAKLAVTLPPLEFRGNATAGVAVHLGVEGSLPLWTETGCRPCNETTTTVRAHAWAESDLNSGAVRESPPGPAELATPALWTQTTAGAGHSLTVSAGGDHSLVLLEDGSVRAFGYGIYGQLGYGSTKNTGDTQATLPSFMGGVPLGGRAVAVSAGGSHSLVLLEDGSVRAFGSGGFGQLGYGSTNNTGDTQATLPSVKGGVPLGGRAVAVSAGGYHSLVLLEDGSVRAFGRGGFGQLGYGSTNNTGDTQATLPSVMGGVPLGGRAVAVSAGGYHSLVLLEDGSVRAFGRGQYGQLGYGSTANVGTTQATLPSVMGGVPLGGRAVAVSAGGSHSLVLLEDGSVRAFGFGAVGLLGYGSRNKVGDTQATLPSVMGGVPLGGRAVAVSAGGSHSLVLLEDGSVRAFGFGAVGLLGYGSTDNVGDTQASLPSVMGGVPLGGRAVAVSAGGSHSLVLLEDGSVRAFGFGAVGQLGYGSTSNVGGSLVSLPWSQQPVSVVQWQAQSSTCSASDQATTASLTKDNVPQLRSCQVSSHSSVRSQPRRYGGLSVSVSVSVYHSLVLLEDGSVRAFGIGDSGRLGYGSTNNTGDTQATLPSFMGGVPLGGRAVAVSAGGHHSLVLLEDGSVRAFGRGSFGQLGYGSTNNTGDTQATLPSFMGGVPLGGRAVAVSAGEYHSLVLLEDGSVRAFGRGGFGQLGYGSTNNTGDTQATLPSFMGGVPLGGKAVAVSAGGYHSLVLLEDGSVRAFGRGQYGQLGYGSTNNTGDTQATLPSFMGGVPLGGKAVAVSAGGYHSLVLLEDGSVRAFGRGDSGQLGYGSTNNVGATQATLPSAMGGVPLGGRAVAVSAGGSHSLVLLEDGSVRAFGSGGFGQLGYGSRNNVGDTQATLPSFMGGVPLGGRAVAVSAGGYHSLVLLEDGSVRAFGFGIGGQLGYGSTDNVGDTSALTRS
ncbi:hypothetical protein FNF27_05842 [Cafeteria roenbergensis]|uniref:RCC1-like domain-containing protein n=1 Tax=Cafeteria roenbergensis TaxID=33653 RepID=A0A5A8E4A1_CAFRO|nr:hypothetical protein FNF27_05842 [Cafeteria roenbergensis]